MLLSLSLFQRLTTLLRTFSVADLLTPEQEVARVLPVIQALMQEEATARMPLSVDTFYADVVRHVPEWCRAISLCCVAHSQSCSLAVHTTGSIGWLSRGAAASVY